MFAPILAKTFPRKQLLHLTLLLVSGILGWCALRFTLHGELNADEGFYLAASRLVADGERLYRDFGFTQGPILPYANLPWHSIFGYTLAGERLASCAWTALALVLGTTWLIKRHSIEAGLCFLFLLCGAPLWLALAVKGKTYAFSGLCVLLGSIAISANSLSWICWVVFVCSAACGVGARYPTVAFYLPASIGLLIGTAGWKRRALGLLCLLIVGAAEIFWAASGDWENFFFWTADFHRHSTFVSPLGPRLWECILYAPGIWIGLGALLAFRKLSVGHRSYFVVGCLILGCIGNVGLRTSYAEYLAPFIPALAYALSPHIAEWVKARHVLQFLVGGGCIAVAGWPFAPALTPDILLNAAQASAFLRSNTAPNALVAASMPEVPIGAERRIPLALAMGKFAMTEDYPVDLAQRRRMVTPELYGELLQNEAVAAVVLSRGPEWNFSWSVPSYRPLSNSGAHKIASALQRGFTVAYANDHYVILLRGASSNQRH